MSGVVSSLAALFLSVVILLTGHGLQLTIAPLYANELGWSSTAIGYTGSAYFLGFVLGCLTIPRLVSAVGHIRVFSVLAASATVALLLLSLSTSLPGWLGARLITGWAMAGLYMVIESWLNERTTPENRGVVLSFYTILTLAAICVGQLLIGLNLSAVQLIVFGAILLAIGSIPVGLTRTEAPAPIPEVGFKLRAVYSEAHVAVWGAAVGGLVTSGYWVLGPIVAKGLALSDNQIGTFLAVALLGGALLQLPVGRLSDRFDRRAVLACLAGVGALIAFLAFFFAGANHYLLYLFMFLFGGTTFPLYSISLAHANDRTSLSMLETGSVILLVHAAGAVIGPLILASIMDYTPFGLFIFAAFSMLIFSFLATWRVFVNEIAEEDKVPFTGMTRTTHEVFEIVDAEIEDLETVSENANSETKNQPS